MREIRLERRDFVIIRPSADQADVEMVIFRRDGDGAPDIVQVDDERAVEMAEQLLACAREVRRVRRMREIADEVRRRRRS